jgi:hypothetical protein
MVCLALTLVCVFADHWQSHGTHPGDIAKSEELAHRHNAAVATVQAGMSLITCFHNIQ